MKENNHTTQQNTFELLAPAGSLAIFKAVVAAGADAVYVGGSKFGARAYADNFSDEELLEALGYAHLYVQDFGVLTAIHERFPDLAIHTSTQMTVTGVEAARLFSGYGVTRMVMARELSLNEMKRIREETGMELEAFVHGALCYCYSGQCLLSSMIGGRSGNRGQCAQPCRLPYQTEGKKPRQMCAAMQAPLRSAG